jgi:hypothetical protein
MLDRVGKLIAHWVTGSSAGYARVAFYDELLHLLESHGLNKEPSWTARQFAHHAQAALERIPAGTAAAHVPVAVVDRYYRVRFGQRSLDQTESAEINRMLELLGSTVKR